MLKEDFNFYSGFCHFLRLKENIPDKICTHFSGAVYCDFETCPLVKERHKQKEAK